MDYGRQSIGYIFLEMDVTLLNALIVSTRK